MQKFFVKLIVIKYCILTCYCHFYLMTFKLCDIILWSLPEGRMAFMVTVVAYSHCMGTGPGQVQGTEQKCSDYPRQGRELGPICAGPVVCTCPGSAPLQCKQAITYCMPCASIAVRFSSVSRTASLCASASQLALAVCQSVVLGNRVKTTPVSATFKPFTKGSKKISEMIFSIN